jgi:heme/copper-type cytochrome/quinol oxidase subunit 1
MPRRIFTYSPALNVESYNLLSTIGAFVFGFSGLIMAWNLYRSARRGDRAGANPWDAPHLEWAIPSPPHHYNFPVIPEVRSREPLWNPEERRAIEAVTMGSASPEPVMPNPSYWPILLAGSITLAWGMVLTGTWWLIVLGLLPVVLCVFMWAFEPAFPEGHGH